MSKILVRLLTIILAIAMVASLAVGCGGTTDVNGDESSDLISSDENGDENDEDSNDEDEDSSDKKSSNKKSSNKKSSNKKSSNKNSSSDKNNNSSSGKVDPKDYEGTTVTYVTWKDPALNEDGPVVKAFEQKYGIKVKIQLVEQKNYVSIIASNIASGTQGDIFFENETFPGSLTVMQPLDAAMLDLSDPIWNQDLIKASTLDGHAYLVDTMSNIWAERNILVYNKSIFQNNNITTPADYVKAGKWTFENFRYVCNQIKSLGKAYKGAALIGEPAIASCGASLFDFKNNKMVVTANKRFYDAMNLLSSMKSDGLVHLGYEAFGDGTYGMAITNCFGLKKTGYYTNFNSSHLAATYVPSWSASEEAVNSSLFRGWGLIDGAKNPVAAGIFLREYLDINNYDVSTAFHNSDVANFFFQITGDTTDLKYYYGGSMCKIYNSDIRIHEAWASQSPATMNSYLDGQKNVMNNMANKANADIEKERKYLKATFGG